QGDPQTVPPHGPCFACRGNAAHGAPSGVTTRDASGLPMPCVGPKRRRRGTRSGFRVRSRVTSVKKTMIANRMKAIAAPTPHSLLLNEVLNERNAGVMVVFSGLPFVPT